MNVKGKYSESFPMYMAFLAAGAVAAIIGFFIIYNSLGAVGTDAGPDAQVTEETPAATSKHSGSYIPTEDESEQMKDAAIELIGNNYEVLKLYYIKGMSHEDEPYGNLPEDNYYTVNSQTYTSIGQLEQLVDSTYTADTANEVKTDPLGYGAIYAVRDNGDLGIIYGFTPMEYDISWENPNFKLYPLSEDKCTLTVTLSKKDSGEAVEREGAMTKTDDGWRLDKVIY